MEKAFAKPKIIKDVKNDDFQVQITGHVKNLIDNNSFQLDDTTGQIKVTIKDIEFNFKENDLINVIGEIIITTDGEMTFQAEMIQDMNKLNFKYYLKLYELRKEIEEI